MCSGPRIGYLGDHIRFQCQSTVVELTLKFCAFPRANSEINPKINISFVRFI